MPAAARAELLYYDPNLSYALAARVARGSMEAPEEVVLDPNEME